MMERRVWVVLAECHCSACKRTGTEVTCLGVYTTRRDAQLEAVRAGAGRARIEEHILEEEWNA